jgi:hypothetical protein
MEALSMTLAEMPRALRTKNGLTQDPLAKVSGLPLWTVRN